MAGTPKTAPTSASKPPAPCEDAADDRHPFALKQVLRRNARGFMRPFLRVSAFFVVSSVLSVVNGRLWLAFNAALVRGDARDIVSGDLASVLHSGPVRVLLAITAVSLIQRLFVARGECAKQGLEVDVGMAFRAQALDHIQATAEFDDLNDTFHKTAVVKLARAQAAVARYAVSCLEVAVVACNMVASAVTVAMVSWEVVALAVLLSVGFRVAYLNQRTSAIRAQGCAAHEFAHSVDAQLREKMASFRDTLVHGEYPSLREFSLSRYLQREQRFRGVADLWRARYTEMLATVEVTTLACTVLYMARAGSVGHLMATFHTLTASLRSVSWQLNRANDIHTRMQQDEAVFHPFARAMRSLRQRRHVPPVEFTDVDVVHVSRRLAAPGRLPFHLRLSVPEQVLRLQAGDTVQLLGSTGHGKSTLIAILSGETLTTESHCDVRHAGGDAVPGGFHALQHARVIARQDYDRDVSFRGSVASVLAPWGGMSDDEAWEVLRLVEMEEFVTRDLGGNLHQPLRNEVSGGQKMRLALGRVLHRARTARLLILDEPDKGLPTDMVHGIMERVVKWFKPRGVLVLTLHTQLAPELYGPQKLVNKLWRVQDGVLEVVAHP